MRWFVLVLTGGCLLGCGDDDDKDPPRDAMVVDAAPEGACRMACIERLTACGVDEPTAPCLFSAVCVPAEAIDQNVACLEATDCEALEEAALGDAPVCGLGEPAPVPCADNPDLCICPAAETLSESTMLERAAQACLIEAGCMSQDDCAACQAEIEACLGE